MALSHLISSSSLGAHSKRVRLVVTILNVFDLPSGADDGGMGDDDTNGDDVGIWRFGGRSYSSASRICENLNSRCGFVSYTNIIRYHIEGMEWRTDHMAARINQPLAVEYEPSFPPIMPLGPTLHQISRDHNL